MKKIKDILIILFLMLTIALMYGIHVRMDNAEKILDAIHWTTYYNHKDLRTVNPELETYNWTEFRRKELEGK